MSLDMEHWNSTLSKKAKKKLPKAKPVFGHWGMVPPEEEASKSDSGGDGSVYDFLRFGFPILSHEHGSEIVTISVGRARRESIPKEPFNIHKKLLIRASEFFSTALQNNFVEGKTNHIDLDWACPAAFEVLYQALYTGRVFPANFYTHYYNRKHNGNIHEDVLWLRTFNLAYFTMFRDLLSVAYKRIRQLFNSHDRRVPSPLFIQELFNNNDDSNDDEAPTTTSASTHLHTFIVQHTAYWMQADNQADCEEWKKILSGDNSFATAVVCRLAELLTHQYEGLKDHPTKDDAFDHNKFFARVYGQKMPLSNSEKQRRKKIRNSEL